MVSRFIQNTSWRIKTSLKLEELGRGWRMGRDVAVPFLLISSAEV